MKAYDYSYDEANKLTLSLPYAIDGKDATYSLMLDVVENPDKYSELKEKETKQCEQAIESLNILFEKYPEVYDAIIHLKGCIDHISIHASGVVVSGKSLRENIPLVLGSDTAIIPLVQINMDDLPFFNALKIDVLGLNTLTQIKSAMDLSGLDFEWFDSEEFNDPKVYEMFRRGETTDIFQISKKMATLMAKTMDVTDIEGLTALNAGDRPGCLGKDKTTGTSMVDDYVERKKSKIIPKLHPEIDKILASTYGCIFYQEQCIELGVLMAGYTTGMADARIRRILAKKKVEKIPELRNEFIYGKQSLYNEKHEVIGVSEEDSKNCIGCIKNGFSEELAIKIFDIMEKFAKYAFNLAHAGCYAAMIYKTGWLSLYKPVEWAVACLNSHDGDIDKITATLALCKKRQIKIFPPDINISKDNFTMDILDDGEKTIHYGLTAIKGLGIKGMELITELRKLGGYTSFEDFYNRIHYSDEAKAFITKNQTDPNKKGNTPIDLRAETALICSGVFDIFEKNRHKLINYYMKDIRKDKDFVCLDEKENPNIITCWNKQSKLGYEKEYMGAYISEHPLDPFSYADIDLADNKEIIKTTGYLRKVKVEKIKNRQDKYATITIEDKFGKMIKIKLFGKVYEKYKDTFEKGKAIVVTGEVSKKFNNLNGLNIKKLVARSTIIPTKDIVEEDIVESIIGDNNITDGYVMPIRANPLDDLGFNSIEEFFGQCGGQS